VRTTEVGGPRGYDGGKKISGRKRQMLMPEGGADKRIGRRHLAHALIPPVVVYSDFTV
jgi:hypothetical protein